MNKLVASIKTARMSEAELLAYGFTHEDIEAGAHLPPVKGAVGNSTAILADMASAVALAPYSATAQAAAQAAAGPMEDLPAMIKSVLLNFQEAKQKLNYILGSSMLTPTGGVSAPTGGLITSGADGATYNLLVGIFQILV